MNPLRNGSFLFAFLLGVTMSSSHASYVNQNKEKGPGELRFFDTLTLIKKVLCESDSRIPKSPLPEVKPDLAAFLEPSETMKFIWFGHSTLLLNLDGQIILMDPVFFHASPTSLMVKRFQPPVLSLSELPAINTIVISHDHYDHLDKKTIAFFRDKTNHFLVPKGVGVHLRDWGIEAERITELMWNESVERNGLLYRALPAQHFSGRGLFDRNETLWASWAIKGKTENIYFSGDSGYGPHFEEIGDQHGPFDYAFLENGQYNERWPDIHMQPEETLQAYVDLNAKHFVPIHWGMFDLSLHHWSEPVKRSHEIAKAWHIPIITPRLGEVVDEDHRPDMAWWELVKDSMKETNESRAFLPAATLESAGPR
jgi:L-ascorbate metabolism protein UlaG (beta-lactamase superfamily)